MDLNYLEISKTQKPRILKYQKPKNPAGFLGRANPADNNNSCITATAIIKKSVMKKKMSKSISTKTYVLFCELVPCQKNSICDSSHGNNKNRSCSRHCQLPNCNAHRSL